MNQFLFFCLLFLTESVFSRIGLALGLRYLSVSIQIFHCIPNPTKGLKKIASTPLLRESRMNEFWPLPQAWDYWLVLYGNSHFMILPYMTVHSTPPRTSFMCRLFDDRQSLNAERHVYGKIWTTSSRSRHRCYSWRAGFGGNRLSISFQAAC